MSSSLGHLTTESTIADRLSPPLRTQPQQSQGKTSPVGLLSGLGVDNHEDSSDSEAETIVLTDFNRRNGLASRDRDRGRDRRRVSLDDDDNDNNKGEEEGDGDGDGGDEGDAGSTDTDGGRSMRRPKRSRKRRMVDADSSELSPAPSSPVRGASHIRAATTTAVARNGLPPVKSQHHISGLLRKRKVSADSEQHTNGSLRNRQARSPKPSTRFSPLSPSPPLTLPIQRNKTINSLTKAPHKTKQRKVPRPLTSVRDKLSSEDRSPSSSRQGSPTSSLPQLPRPTAARALESPVNLINMPHKPKRDASGRTLLHRAAQRGNLEEVKNIFNQNQDLLNEEDNAGYIPLHEASLSGHADVVRFLLECGSDVDKQSHTDRDTPLMDAVENGHLDVVKILLEHGADPKIRDKSGSNALECIKEVTPDSTAIEETIRAALQKRRSKRSSDDENRNSVTVESHSSRDPSVASPIHDTAPLNSRQITGRRRTARADQTKNEMLWVEGGKNGQQKLREKACLGDIEIVYACLERGVQPDVESLIGAIKGGHDETVSLLLAFGANADPEIPRSASTGKRISEETPMLAAIGRNNLKILEYLLARVDPLRKDGRGKSYMDISRERAGDNWEDEIRMLQAAYDKAMTNRGGKPDKSPASKKSIENPNVKRSRPRQDSSTSTSIHRRSGSTQSKREYNDSDPESSGDFKLCFTERQPQRGPDHSIVRKKRRLIPGKELLAEKCSTRAQESRISNCHIDSTMNDLYDLQSPRLKTESKEVDMLDIPEVKSNKRVRSRDQSHERTISVALPKNDSEKPVTKETALAKKRDKEIDNTITKPTRPDLEKRKRKVDVEGMKARDESTTRKLKRSADASNGRLKDSRREELRTKRVESETRSDVSGKEEDAKKAIKDHDLIKARKLAKEEKKKRLTSEEIAERKRKAEETERREREQRREAEERRELLRSEYLVSEQKSIMDKAFKESTRSQEEHLLMREKLERERLERERLEKIAEQNRLNELRRREKRLEEEKRQAEEKKRQEEEEEERRRIAEEERRRIAEEERRRIAEEERRRIAEEEEKRRLQQEEEARARAAEERLAREAAELQRELERQQQEEARRLLEEEMERRRLHEEQCRLAEERRIESLPVALRLAAKTPSVPSVSEVGGYLPLYLANLYDTGCDSHPSESCSSGWVLNIQAALILGITNLSFEECGF